MLGIGHWYVLLIFAVIALIIFGPSRLPELGSGLGRAIREFRKATTEMGEALKDETHKVGDTTPTAVGTTYSASPTPSDEPATPAEPSSPSAPAASHEAPKA